MEETSNLAGSARSCHSSITWFQSTSQSCSLSSPMMLCLENLLKSYTCITNVDFWREDFDIWEKIIQVRRLSYFTFFSFLFSSLPVSVFPSCVDYLLLSWLVSPVPRYHHPSPCKSQCFPLVFCQVILIVYVKRSNPVPCVFPVLPVGFGLLPMPFWICLPFVWTVCMIMDLGLPHPIVSLFILRWTD